MKKRIVRNIQNFYFLLFTFATGLFYFCFYSVSLVFGLSMSFTLIGVPLLAYVMRTTHTFVQYERIQTKIYTDISIEPYDEKPRIEGSLWMQAREELLDRRNWKAIFWLMQKLVVGLVCLICAAVLYIVPMLFMLAPLLFPFVDINVMSIPVNTWAKSLVMLTAGGSLALAGSWFGDGLVLLAGGYTRHMYNDLRRWK